jgi:hypothetical protein
LNFLGNSLEKLWPSEVATLGTLPEAKWPKKYFCQFFSGNILAKWWPLELAIGSGHFGDPPRGQMAKKIFLSFFFQETSWQNGSHRKWPFWGPSLGPNGQKIVFVRQLSGKIVVIGS